MAKRRLAVRFGYFCRVSRINGRYGSTFERRRGGSVLGRPAWASTRVTVPWCTLTGDGADAPFLDVIIAQNLRLKLKRDGHGALLVSDRRPTGAGTRCGHGAGSD